MLQTVHTSVRKHHFVKHAGGDNTMKKFAVLMASLLFGGLFGSTQAAADIKYFPGSFCMSQTATTNIVATSKGAAVNESTTTTYMVTCPIVADTANSMASAKIYYWDNHSTSDAGCHICTVDANADVYECSPTITTTTNQGSNPTEYSFSNLPSFYTSPGGTRIITCQILPKYNGYYSGVWSYTIDEN